MKTIEKHENGKTIIKIVPDNYEEPDFDLQQNDLTTSIRKSIGFSDISKDKWEKIFGNTGTTREESIKDS